MRNGILVGNALQFGLIHIRRRNDFDLVQFLIIVQMMLADLAYANDANSRSVHG